MEEGCETMFILLFPMGMGILAWIFGLRQIMRAVSDQRMVCRFDQRMQQWMKDGGTEETAIAVPTASPMNAIIPAASEPCPHNDSATRSGVLPF